MKNFLLFTLLFSFFSVRIFAQCNPVIPSNAIVVNFTDTINGGFDPIWVCSGDSLHTDGGFHNIYLEPGAVMTSGGGIDTIYVKFGASLFMYGGIDYIVYDTISDLHSLSGIPTLDSSCNGIVFNYINAPLNGCLVAPVANFNSSDTEFCAGNCVGFSNQSAGAISYSWLFPGGNPSTSTDINPTTVCYNVPGNYDVTLIAINGSGSDTLVLPGFIHVDSLPVIVASTLVICQGQNGLLTASGADNFSWDPSSGLNATIGDTVNANPDSTTNYIVTGINSSGCSGSANTIVTVNPLPSIPILTQNGDTMFSSIGYTSYQWYNGVILISGATNYYYIGLQSGDYHVIVTNEKGCEATEEIIFVFNGTGDLIFDEIQLSVFPNPTSGNFILKINSNSAQHFNITVTGLEGREIVSQNLFLQKGTSTLKFNLSNQPSGVYFIHSSTAQFQLNKKLVLVH